MSKKLSLITLGSFILSIICGVLLPNVCTSIEFIGTIYVNLLKIMIVPVLFTSIASALSRAKNNAKKITGYSILTFVIMFVASFIICTVMWCILNPGHNAFYDEVEWTGTVASTTFAEFCINLFPNNIITAMSNNSILPVIIFAFVFGIALRGSEHKTLDNLTEAFNKMLSYVMYITPIGVFALMGNTVATYGTKIISTAAKYVGMAWLGCVVIEIIVMILPVWIVAKINPITYLKKVYKIWLITLSTCSSAATLPNTVKVCNEDFGISKDITNIVVPLGCTIHMCGGAVSFSLLGMFVLQIMDYTLTPSMFVLMLASSLLINMGAPGIPGGGIAIGASYLGILGLPYTFIGFYAGIYRLLDMAYTTMNVTGDITANILISRFIDEKTE